MGIAHHRLVTAAVIFLAITGCKRRLLPDQARTLQAQDSACANATECFDLPIALLIEQVALRLDAAVEVWAQIEGIPLAGTPRIEPGFALDDMRAQDIEELRRNIAQMQARLVSLQEAEDRDKGASQNREAARQTVTQEVAEALNLLVQASATDDQQLSQSLAKLEAATGKLRVLVHGVQNLAGPADQSFGTSRPQPVSMPQKFECRAACSYKVLIIIEGLAGASSNKISSESLKEVLQAKTYETAVAAARTTLS